jgi:chromate transporter
MAEGNAPHAQVAPFTILTTFALIGLSSVGGGGSAHIHEWVVHRRKWLEEERFIEAMTIARSLPGTNVSNLAAFVGGMLAGYRGAACAAIGVVLPGLLLILGLAIAYVRLAALHSPVVQSILHGLTAGALGVMGALVYQSARSGLKGHRAIALAAFVAVAILYVNLGVVLLAMLPIASALTKKKQT